MAIPSDALRVRSIVVIDNRIPAMSNR